MHADELREAVVKIVELLRRSDIRRILDRYRAARGDDRALVSARLGHAGAMIVEGMQGLSGTERRVVRLMHLEELGTPEYWQTLLEGTADVKAHHGDIVRLASRVMFATGQLPALVALLGQSGDGGKDEPERRLPEGERRFVIRLADAGERASDPERIARSIEGVDMLYSACAILARKPAVNLRLDAVDGSVHRDLHFSGDGESLSAVTAVIESIPAALADIEPEGDADLEEIIASLPVFEDLDKLGAVGVFSARELKDIGETLHQGALLVLESGAVPVDEGEPPPAARPEPVAPAATISVAPPAENVETASDTPSAGEPPAREPAAAVEPDASSVEPDASSVEVPETNGVNGDEHYERYLREREAMQSMVVDGGAERPADRRRDAVEELLRSLDRTRNGG